MAALRLSPRTPPSADRPPTVPESDPSPTSPIPSTSRTPSVLNVLDQAHEILLRFVSAPTARSILSLAERRKGSDGAADLVQLIGSIERSVALFVTDANQVQRCCSLLRKLADAGPTVPTGAVVPILVEDDIVKARLEGRRAAAAAGFSTVGVTRLMTAISEVARNIVLYAGQGQVEILGTPRGVEIVARDRGPGIVNLDQVLAGNHKSRLGMGLGLRGVKKLAETFEVQTGPGRGTTVRFTVKVA
jgi:serine/threonine-protein kinase RsbT